jgi:hypothetical protein
LLTGSEEIMTESSSRRRCVASSFGLLALLLFTNAAAQSASSVSTAETARQAPTAGPEVVWEGGQLKIVAYKSTLADVLAKVVAVTGAKIEIPPGAGAEFMPFVELGPGRASEVIDSLLAGTKFDYAILASDTDPRKIDSVLLMPRAKTSPGEMATQARNSYPTAEAHIATAPEPSVTPVAAPQPAADTSPVADPNQQPPSVSSDSGQPAVRSQPEQSSSPRPGALSPPQTLTPSSINAQLQQMYQQRIQMVQQARQNGVAGP